MIKLYQFATCWGLPNVSPFCMKLETYLKMVGLPYQIMTVANPSKSPTGKFPMIEDEGKIIADSGLIITYLKEKYGDPLDKDLTDKENAQRIAIQRLLEEHLYWVIVYGRWSEDAGWKTTKANYFDFMPKLLQWFVPALIRKSVLKSLNGHGLGRHPRDNIYALAKEDATVLETYLSENDYLLGNVPTSIDASAYAFIANILQSPLNSPLKQYMQSKPVFAKYCEKMKAKYFQTADNKVVDETVTASPAFPG